MSNISNASKVAVKRSLGTLDEIAETLAGMRGKQEQYAVRQSDLVRLGLARYVGGKLVAQAAQEQGGTIVAPPPPPPAPTATLGMSLVASGNFAWSANVADINGRALVDGGEIDTGFALPAQNYQSATGPIYLAQAYLTNGVYTDGGGTGGYLDDVYIKATPAMWGQTLNPSSPTVYVGFEVILPMVSNGSSATLSGTMNWSLYRLQVA